MNTAQLPDIWRVLARALTGAPFVPIGPYFFNVLAIERAYYLQKSDQWEIHLTNKAIMHVDQNNAASLVESFAEAPFAPHNSTQSEKAYFNVGCVVMFELYGRIYGPERESLRAHLMSGEVVYINDVAAFRSHLESALTRASLMMGNQGGGKRH